MTGMTSLTQSSVSRDAVADYIEREIVSGHLSPGTKLPSERQLADRFGISRPIVREALRALVERNLIEVRRPVAPTSPSANVAEAASRLDNLFRLSSSPPASSPKRAKCWNRPPPDWPRTCHRDRPRRDRAGSGTVRADHPGHRTGPPGLHLSPCDRARIGQSVIEAMFMSIASLTFQLMLRSLIDKEVVKESLPYHRAVFDAIEARDPAAASTAMLRHLNVARMFYGSDFDASLESIARREVAELVPGNLAVADLIGSGGGMLHD